MRVGQHSSCNDYWIVKQTKLATIEEYTPLLEELKSIGYTPRILKRIPKEAFYYRKKALGA